MDASRSPVCVLTQPWTGVRIEVEELKLLALDEAPRPLPRAASSIGEPLTRVAVAVTPRVEGVVERMDDVAQCPEHEVAQQRNRAASGGFK
jgi:hypothetical protein